MFPHNASSPILRGTPGDDAVPSHFFTDPPAGQIAYLAYRERALDNLRRGLSQAISAAAELEFDPEVQIAEDEYIVLCRIQLKANLAHIKEARQLREMRVQA